MKQYRVEGTDLQFTSDELLVINHFFDCGGDREKISEACQKYESLFNCFDICPDEKNAGLKLVFALADSLFKDFHDVGSRLEYRVRKNKCGRPRTVEVPHDFIEKVNEVKKETLFSDAKAINYLRKKDIIKGKESVLIKKLSRMRSQREEAKIQLLEDFSNLDKNP